MSKTFAKLYHKSTNFDGKGVKSIPMCGSDSMVYLDGRKSLANQVADVRAHVAKLQSAQPARYDSITGFQVTRSAGRLDVDVGGYQTVLAGFPVSRL